MSRILEMETLQGKGNFQSVHHAGTAVQYAVLLTLLYFLAHKMFGEYNTNTSKLVKLKFCRFQ